MKQKIIELAKQAGFYQDAPMYYDEEMLCKFFRIAYARGMLKQEEQSRHWSDCATNSEPAYPAGECDCGGYITITKQWSDLTDSEMTECIVNVCNTDDGTADTRDLICAVQTKLKEKNTI